jgi:hypothetical protein
VSNTVPRNRGGPGRGLLDVFAQQHITGLSMHVMVTSQQAKVSAGLCSL